MGAPTDKRDVRHEGRNTREGPLSTRNARTIAMRWRYDGDMMRYVGVLAVSSALTGCYAAHGVSAASAPDARVAFDAQLGVDVGIDTGGIDAGSIDAGRDASVATDATCTFNPSDRVVLACVLNSMGVIPPMRESRLILDRSACVCAAQRACSVRVDGDILRIETRSCEEEVECDSCDFDQTCVVPPLPPGQYRLVVDGLETYSLDVGGALPAPAGPRCYRLPAPRSDLPDDFCTAPRGISDFSRACHRPLEDVGARATITLTSTCLDCNLWSGGCEARVEGTRIVLSPRLQDCTCTMSGCAGVCESCTTHEITCTTPALRAGDYTIETPGRGVFATMRVEDVIAPSPIRCIDSP